MRAVNSKNITVAPRHPLTKGQGLTTFKLHKSTSTHQNYRNYSIYLLM